MRRSVGTLTTAITIAVAISSTGLAQRGGAPPSVSAVFLVRLDPATGKAVGPPARVSRADSDSSKPAWSRDSRELAFVSFTQRGADGSITVARIDTGQQREIRPDIPGGLPIAAFIDWSPDGQSFIVDGAPVTVGGRPTGAYKVDVRDGDTTTVASNPNVVVHHSRWLPDGHSIVYVDGRKRLVVRNLETGDERTVYTSSSPFDSLVLTQDGRTAAFRDILNRTIMVLELAGGSARPISKTDRVMLGGGQIGLLAWSADARFLISVDQERGKESYGVWRVPVAGGAPENIGLALDGEVNQLATSPDGNWLAIVMANSS